MRMFGVGRIIEGIVKDSLQNVSQGAHLAGWCELRGGPVRLWRVCRGETCQPEEAPLRSWAPPLPARHRRRRRRRPLQTYKKLPEIVRRWQMFREEALRSGDTRQLLLGRPPVGCEVAWIRQEVLAVLKVRCGALLPAAGAELCAQRSAGALRRPGASSSAVCRTGGADRVPSLNRPLSRRRFPRTAA